MNKKFYRILSIIGVFIFSFSLSFNTLASEVTSDAPSIITYEKIQDPDILLERAINGENDAPAQVVESIKENTVLSIDGVEQTEEPLVTTELLSISQVNDEVSESYAATVISNLEIVDNQLRATSSYSKEEHVSSSGGEITLYTTIYFEVGDITIALKKVSTRAVVNVGRVTVDYVKIRYGYTGINFDTRGLARHTSTWYSKTGTSNTVTVNAPKIECVPGGVLYSIWGEGAAHVNRGSSSWTTSHKVVEADMGWFM